MRRRIILTAVAMCALGILVLFVPLAVAVRDQNTREDQLELQRLAAVAARSVPVDLEDLDEVAGWQPDGDAEHSYAVYDASGQRVAGSGPDSADAVVAAALTGTVAAGTVGADTVAAIALGTGNQVTGALRVAEPAQEGSTRTQARILQMALIALGAIAVAAVVGWLLFLRLLRPVDKLTAAAVSLGDGDFAVEVPRTGMPELDQVGEALTASAERIGELVQRERAFSAEASHELRTPLASARVVLESELLAPHDDPRLALVEAIAMLDRLEDTVTDLLLLSRDDHADRALIDLRAAIDAAVERWAAHYRGNARTLQVDPDATGQAHTSASAFSHILDVLLDNALRHGAGRVTIGTERAVGGVAVTVTDEGTVTRSNRELFQRRHRDATGTGIGLALARSLAEAEGARLALRASTPTTFELIFPDTPTHRG